MASSKQASPEWATGHDERVEVNQRALIDKILARYSGKFTVFRELLQNSDDAESTSVEIRFETEAYLSRENSDGGQSNKRKRKDLQDPKNAVVHRWTFKNNGIVFRDQDWDRLKKIAEGNPDEEKIGAFGVGFYSLFSVTDEPWVMSGEQWMNFYWKDRMNQLYVRRGTVPASDDVDNSGRPWTTFQMTLRERGLMPPAFDLTRFLVSSMTFMTHLSEISVYFDDKRLVKLFKDCGMPKEVPMIMKGLKATSPERMMNVKSIETIPLRIKADVARWVYTLGSETPSASTSSKTNGRKSVTNQTNEFFSSLFTGFGAPSTPRRAPTPVLAAPKESKNLLEANSSSIGVTIFAANVDVQLDDKMTAELLRSTLKKPPSQLHYKLIYTKKEEYDSSVKFEEEAAYAAGSVFQGLRADLEGTGSTRVFIGHATGQTTGIGGHMAARFIPTVERESIDLADRNVTVWNEELLYVGGLLARSVYEFELDTIRKEWESAATSKGPGGLPDEDVQNRLRKRTLHALKFFSFHPSTPSPVVSNRMKTAFFTCATDHPLSIISTSGVRNLSQVHISNPKFSGFVKLLPLIPEDIVSGAKVMIAVLRSQGMIKEITFGDVLNELRSRPLSEAETVDCLEWWIGITRQGYTLERLEERTQLLNALEVSVSGPSKKITKFSNAQKFLNSKSWPIIPTDGPLPSTVIPTSITSLFDPSILFSVFLWEELSITEWLRHVTDPEVAAANAEFDVTRSAPWAERVLSVLAKARTSLPVTSLDDCIATLASKSCIPTSTGLKVPDQTYLPGVNLFRDLPIVAMPSGTTIAGDLEFVLQALGVHKYVQLEIIFDRMIETGDWTTFDLVKYLVSISPPLSITERLHLGETPAFPKEYTRKGQSAAGAQRYKARDLYEPIDIFRELDLPIIDWGVNNGWKPESDEAKFVLSLGLRRAPPLIEIIHFAASDNLSIRAKALSFLLNNMSDFYVEYDPKMFYHVAFVPAILGSEKVLARPLEVYTDVEWAALGFTIVDPTLQDGATSRLKLNKHPPTSELVALLKRSPPSDEITALQWFGVLSGRVSDFSPAELRELTVTSLVPVKSTGDKGTIKRLRPDQCFLGAATSELYSKLFSFVDFGTRANVFLRGCGARQEPSVEDFARLLLEEPRRIYELANGRENYLYELRNLAVNRRRLSLGITLRMKRSKVLLGSRRVKKDGGKALDEANREDWDFQDDLFRPSEVVIADDTDAYKLFSHRIYCAPKEDILEDLYLFLGSPCLSSLVKEHYETLHEDPFSKIGTETRHLILERLPLFLHEYPQSNTEVSLDWLDKETNLIIKVFKNVSVTKTLDHENIREFRSHEASAVAKREGDGPIELWLSGNKEVNMYEVSTSLCRIIFQSPKANDSLLLMTILSADVKALGQCGYDFDRILQQKSRRQATEMAKPDDTETAGREEAEKDAQAKIPITQTNITLPPAGTVIASPRSTGFRVEQTPIRSRLASVIRVLGHLLSQNRLDAIPSHPTSSSLGTLVLAEPGPSTEHARPPRPDLTVASPSSIAKNIDVAIKACGPEGSDLPNIGEEMQAVLKSLDEGYCHSTLKSEDLELVGSMGDMKVFAAPDLPQPESLIERKRNVLARFIHILTPLVKLYGIPQTSLQIFADKEGKVTSFNRGGCLMMNLRYFEACHDLDIQRGDFNKALMSWYFMMAHGIAHNIVHPHNVEHGFYVSAICEAYLDPLFNLLSNPQQNIGW